MSRYINADAIKYHEDDAVYRWEIDAMPTADVVPSIYGCGSAPYCSDVWEVDEDE